MQGRQADRADSRLEGAGAAGIDDLDVRGVAAEPVADQGLEDVEIVRPTYSIDRIYYTKAKEDKPSKPIYAVLERKDAKGQVYVPLNQFNTSIPLLYHIYF